MPVLNLNSYIEFIRDDRKKRSNITLKNYEKAVKYTGVAEIDTDRLDDTFQTLLVKLENSIPYGYIANTLTLIRRSLHLYGYDEPKGINYNRLLQKLNGAKDDPPEAYTEDEAKLVINVCQSEPELFKTCLLCTYSGLRIGACEGVRYDGFKKMPNGVYVYRVVSKGNTYMAAISEYAYNWLVRMNYPENEFVVPFQKDGKTSFGDIYRKRLIYLMMQKGISAMLREKQPWHGFRKFYAERLNEAKLLPDEIAWLMGHAPRTTAFRYYITDIETGGPRLAELYAKTRLNSLEVVAK